MFERANNSPPLLLYATSSRRPATDVLVCVLYVRRCMFQVKMKPEGKARPVRSRDKGDADAEVSRRHLYFGVAAAAVAVGLGLGLGLGFVLKPRREEAGVAQAPLYTTAMLETGASHLDFTSVTYVTYIYDGDWRSTHAYQLNEYNTSSGLSNNIYGAFACRFQFARPATSANGQFSYLSEWWSGGLMTSLTGSAYGSSGLMAVTPDRFMKARYQSFSYIYYQPAGDSAYQNSWYYFEPAPNITNGFFVKGAPYQYYAGSIGKTRPSRLLRYSRDGFYITDLELNVTELELLLCNTGIAYSNYSNPSSPSILNQMTSYNMTEYVFTDSYTVVAYDPSRLNVTKFELLLGNAGFSYSNFSVPYIPYVPYNATILSQLSSASVSTFLRSNLNTSATDFFRLENITVYHLKKYPDMFFDYVYLLHCIDALTGPSMCV